MINKDNFQATWAYIVRDHESWPLRFWLEVLAWAMSIGAAILFALTVPNIPFILYLTITVSGCAIYAWAAWTRGSVGMLANYLLLTIIDSVGLARVIAS
jgi:hypothetical protein